MCVLGCSDSNSYGITFIFGMVGTHGHSNQSRMITWWYQSKLAGCGSVLVTWAEGTTMNAFGCKVLFSLRNAGFVLNFAFRA